MAAENEVLKIALQLFQTIIIILNINNVFECIFGKLNTTLVKRSIDLFPKPTFALAIPTVAYVFIFWI